MQQSHEAILEKIKSYLKIMQCSIMFLLVLILFNDLESHAKSKLDIN